MTTDRSASRTHIRGRTLAGHAVRAVGVVLVLAALATSFYFIRSAAERAGFAVAPVSGLGNTTPTPVFQPPPLPPAPPAAPATVRWLPGTVVEGSVFSIIVEDGDPMVRSARGTFEGQPLHFNPGRGDALVALVGAPLDSVGARTLRVDLVLVDGTTESRVLELPVARGTYAMQRLTVAPEFGQTQPPEVQRRIDREYARAFGVGLRSHHTPRMWEPPFLAPRDGRVTSEFGHGRTFNDEVLSRHTGTDFAGAVGEPIVAPARGRVALVDNFFLGGNVIYIDHGAGLVTGYLHLSEQLVAEGDTVEAGQTIGRVGATGRVTGPHLHWIVRYGFRSLDGQTLIGDPTAD